MFFVTFDENGFPPYNTEGHPHRVDRRVARHLPDRPGQGPAVLPRIAGSSRSGSRCSSSPRTCSSSRSDPVRRVLRHRRVPVVRGHRRPHRSDDGRDHRQRRRLRHHHGWVRGGQLRPARPGHHRHPLARCSGRRSCSWDAGSTAAGTTAPPPRSPFAALPCLAVGVIGLAPDLEASGTGLLLVAIGLALAYDGATIWRRATSWIGGGTPWPSAWPSSSATTPATASPPRGMLFIAGGDRHGVRRPPDRVGDRRARRARRHGRPRPSAPRAASPGRGRRTRGSRGRGTRRRPDAPWKPPLPPPPGAPGDGDGPPRPLPPA